VALSVQTIHPQQRRDDKRDNRDLPDLDAEIERRKGRDERAPGEAELLQGAGKAEAVDQAEAKCIAPTLLEIAGEEVLGGYVDDRGGNRRLDDAAREAAKEASRPSR